MCKKYILPFTNGRATSFILGACVSVWHPSNLGKPNILMKSKGIWPYIFLTTENSKIERMENQQVLFSYTSKMIFSSQISYGFRFQDIIVQIS